MINLMTCLNRIGGSGEGGKFVGGLLSYVDDKIKAHDHENIAPSSDEHS